MPFPQQSFLQPSCIDFDKVSDNISSFGTVSQVAQLETMGGLVWQALDGHLRKFSANTSQR